MSEIIDLEEEERSDAMIAKVRARVKEEEKLYGPKEKTREPGDDSGVELWWANLTPEEFEKVQANLTPEEIAEYYDSMSPEGKALRQRVIDRREEENRLYGPKEKTREPGEDASENTIQENPFLSKIITGNQLHDAFLRSLSLTWRIKGIIPESAVLIALYGDTGSYKSFIALDMALSIAANKPYHGMSVKPCPAAYIAAEGQHGILKRIEAWTNYYEIKNLPFSLIPFQIKINDPQNIKHLIGALNLLSDRPGFLVIDTLSRSLQGNENSTEDIGAFLSACTVISEQMGCQVLFVHHNGKDKARGMRGGYNLTCDTDTVIFAKKEKDFCTTLKNEKQKDHEEFETLYFGLENVSTNFVNDDGDPVNSLVPVLDEDVKPSEQIKNQTLSGAARIALQALEMALDESGTVPTPQLCDYSKCFPSKVVYEDIWRKFSYSMGVSPGDQDAKKKAFQRARNSLINNGIIGTWDDFYWKY